MQSVKYSQTFVYAHVHWFPWTCFLSSWPTRILSPNLQISAISQITKINTHTHRDIRTVHSHSNGNGELQMPKTTSNPNAKRGEEEKTADICILCGACRIGIGNCGSKWVDDSRNLKCAACRTRHTPVFSAAAANLVAPQVEQLEKFKHLRGKRGGEGGAPA